MAKYTKPNWAQAAIAEAAGLEVRPLVVCTDNEYHVSFMNVRTRKEYIVSKIDGGVTEYGGYYGH